MPKAGRSENKVTADQQKLEVALSRAAWMSIREACQKALARPPEARYGFVPAFLAKLTERLKSPPGSAHAFPLFDSTNIPIDGKVCNWINLAELILQHGDETAKSAGAIIVPACSQVIFSRQEKF